MIRDLRYGVRALRRVPAMTLAIIACLAFGIGAVTVVFSLAEGLIFRPLPAVPGVDALVTIRWQAATGFAWASRREYLDWREEAQSMSGLAACGLYLFGVAHDEAATTRAEPVYGAFVSGNYFEVLGIPPALGRTLRDDDDGPTARELVVVISERYWRGAFGRDPAIVGRRLRLNGRIATIVGVAAPGFGGTLAGATFDLWVPLESRTMMVPADSEQTDARATRWLDVIGRRRPDRSLAQVGEELAAIGTRTAARYPDSPGRTLAAGPLDTGSAQQLRPLLASLIALTLVVLLIVCSNVANLLLVRASTRAREIGVRLALGATRLRVFRQLMVENLLLAAAGAAAGLALAAVGRRVLVGLLPVTTVPIDVQAPLDDRVFVVVAGLMIATLLAFGVLPAVTTSGLRPMDALSGGTRGSSAGRGRIRAVLVSTQLALALTTLVCGTLFVRRAEQVQHLERGFGAPANVLLFQTAAALAGYSDLAEWQTTLDRISDRLERLPEVRAAAWASFVPLGYVGYVRRDIDVDGYLPRDGESMRLLVNGVGPGYFDVMMIPVVDGRAIAAEDTADRPGVAMVNEAFVRRFWPAGSPVGRRIAVGKRPMTVVGVAADGRYDYRTIEDPPPPLVYYALRQMPSAFVTLHARTIPAPLEVAPAIREVMIAVDPDLTTLPPLPLDTYTTLPMTPSRAGVMLLGILGAVGLVLSAMGVHAVIAFSVATRRREIGIRLALGASPRRVFGAFVRQALVLAAIGVMAGVVCASAASSALRRLLDRLPQVDFDAMIWPGVLLLIVALASASIPAVRAARVDPARTLRSE